MYVCLCNAFRESDLRDAIVRGARTGEQVFEVLGCDADCGSCLDFTDWFVAETLAAQAAVSET